VRLALKVVMQNDRDFIDVNLALNYGHCLCQIHTQTKYIRYIVRYFTAGGI